MSPSPDIALPKRRVLYIRHRRLKDAADGLRLNQDEWVETLALHADVTVVSDHFDMGDICDRVKPDFIIHESPGHIPAPLEITNPRAHMKIPRFGFQMQDPHDTARVFFFRQVETLGIKYIFSHLTESCVRQSPEMDGRIYALPLLFDGNLFHDYGLEKDTPVSIFGGTMGPDFYNWRAETAREISNYFPTLIYTHPGYEKPTPRHRFEITGEAFAKAINKSHFSLADSTRLDYLVRKHLEIPAAGAVLVAPDAPVLKPYGFRDMENCILGSGMELFKKIAVVADHPEHYERIRKAGHDLVHSRYERKQWRGFIDFYECLRTLKPGEVVQQQGILGPFKAVRGDASTPAIAASIPDSELTVHMNKVQALMVNEGSLDEAVEELKIVALWLEHLTEPWLIVGIIALLKGNLKNAKSLFMMHHDMRLKRDRLDGFDPIEIAWLSLTALLTGDSELLALTRKESATMQHLSLRRMEWLSKIMSSGGDISLPPDNVLHALPDDLISVHWMGQISITQWLSLMRRILAANGQGHLLPA